MAELEQTLDSTEIADMIEKEHSKLLRDIRRYVEQFNEAKIGFVDFFKKSTYVDAKGETRPCYRITRKGCEFIAHKLTGTKGTIFTARYINRFHEMQEALSDQGTGFPWFIRELNGDYVMLFRDFEAITGVNIRCDSPFQKAHPRSLIGGFHYNVSGDGKASNREPFKDKYGFEYDDNNFISYLYPSGIRTVLDLCRKDRRFGIEQSAYDMIMDGLKAIPVSKKPERIEPPAPRPVLTALHDSNTLPVQINIICSKEA